jgi:type IV secretion system protein VirB1
MKHPPNVTLMSLVFVTAAIVRSQTLSPTAFRAIGKACIPQSDRRLVTSIVRTESAFNPYALSINYPATLARRAGFPSGRLFLRRQPRSAKEAAHWATELNRQGMTVSVGLMQVNAEQGYYAITALLDPCENLRIGWSLFTAKYDRAKLRAQNGSQAMRMALSDYNSGSPVSEETNGYVGKVLLGLFSR